MSCNIDIVAEQLQETINIKIQSNKCFSQIDPKCCTQIKNKKIIPNQDNVNKDEIQNVKVVESLKWK